MNKFEFITDENSEIFCNLIVKKMIELFGISEAEAIGRINNLWRGKEIVGDNIIYHEDEEDWGKTMYYDHNSMWWLKEGKEELKPMPYK